MTDTADQREADQPVTDRPLTDRPATGSARRPAPAAQGVRAPWTAIPPHLRDRIAQIIGGGDVVEAVSQAGGFSPGPAVRLRTASGRRAFVKAASTEMNPDTPDIHRREAHYAALLPAGAPVPKLLGSLDEDGWVILVFEEIDGRSPDPDWDPDELRRTVAALVELAETLTPAPIDAPPAIEHLGPFTGWEELRAGDGWSGEGLGPLEGAVRARLDTLVGLESALAERSAGDTLLNFDVRADNLVLTPDRVYFVDWPWTSVGARWLDIALFVPSVWMHCGGERARVVTEHPLLAGADHDAVTAFAAGFAGRLLRQSGEPAPPGLPTIRTFQRAYGTAALEWALTRLR